MQNLEPSYDHTSSDGVGQLNGKPVFGPVRPQDSNDYSDDNDEEEDDLGEYEEEYGSEKELRSLVYSNACPALPTNRPPGYPHLIDASGFCEETDKTDLRCADGVATLLWIWNRQQFNAFFDHAKDKVEIWRMAPSEPIKDMAVTRSGRKAMVGFRVSDGYGDKEWDPQVIFIVEEDGRWIPIMTSTGGSRPEDIEYAGTLFAQQIFYHDLWRDGPGVTFKVW